MENNNMQQQGYQPQTQAPAPQNSNTKVMSVLAYLGILVLIPFFAAKNDEEAQYHTKQGAINCVLCVAYAIATFIINFVVGLIFKPIQKTVEQLSYADAWNYYTTGQLPTSPHPVATAVSVILGLGALFFTVLAIIGIVNAVKGEKKELPIIGKLTFLNNFFPNV